MGKPVSITISHDLGRDAALARLRGGVDTIRDRLGMVRMQLVEERAPDGFEIVTDVLSQQELEDIAANYKRVAGFQVEGLNAKPPIVHVQA